METYTKGMIVRIYCEDFLTFNSIECQPCAKLNMVVGPNGTGKSSLVNAIVLGLGGRINVIGRAKQLSAYVRRGCKTAKIEIELYNEPHNYIIGRTFSTDNKTSSWTINKQHASLKQVEAIIHSLNIQVDNLCQFLPQDRVQDFAKMDSKQLLANTLKTVGSAEVVDMHTSLIELRNKEIQLYEKTHDKKKQLESEKKKIARLETEVQAIKEREEILKTVDIIEKKKAWLELEIIETRKKEVLKDKDQILKMKKSAEKDLVPYQKQIEETRNELQLINKSINNEIKLCGKNTSVIRRKLNDASNTEDQIDGINQELKRKLESEKKRSYKIKMMEEEINKLETLINPGKESKLEREVKELLPLLSEKGREVVHLQSIQQELEEKFSDSSRNKLRLESMLQREMSAANKKKQILEQRFRDTHLAYEWLEKNRNQFQGKIYGPILLEINCGEDVAKYVEFVIPHRDLTAFVCENKDDMNAFLKTVRDGMGYRINTVQATKNFNRSVKENYQPHIPIQALNQFGFWTYIAEQIQGPDPVLNYLCHNYNLHQIPVGNNKTNTIQDKIPDTIRNYFSDTHHYSVKVSKYSGEKLSHIVSVEKSFLLAGSTNHSLIADCKRSIAENVDQINKTTNDLAEQKALMEAAESQLNALRSQKRNLDQELQSLRTGRTKLRMKKEELQAFVSENAVDLEMEKRKAKEAIIKLLVGVCQDQASIKVHLKNYQDSLVRNSLNELKQSSAQSVLKKKQQESLEASKKVEEYKRMMINAEEEVREIESDYLRVRMSALKITEGLSPKDKEFKKKYEQQFASLPNNLELLDTEIAQLTARAGCLAGGRMSIIEEYEKTKKLINDLEKDVANPERKMQELKNEMTQKRAVWMPQVLELISRINKNFTTFFSEMKCVGEVSLEEPDEKDEYSKYGICVKVQFRENGRLQQLGPHTQSGGERAVATALYMLSLQELTTVPFRCVDEINQGMDEYNERVVFSLMVKTVEKAGSAQCFLLTPKILHSLEYSENVRVLCIYNGVFSLSHTEFKVYFEHIKRNRTKTKRGLLKRKHSDSDSSDE